MKWTTGIVLAVLVVLCLPAAASKVDFVIGESDVVINPENPTTADEITVTVTVHNDGLKASKQNKIKLLLKLGNKKIIKVKQLLPVIQPHGSATLTFQLGTLTEGIYLLQVKADPGNSKKEPLEGNNRVIIGFEVLPPTSGMGVGEAAAAVLGTTFQSIDTLMNAVSLGTGGMLESEPALKDLRGIRKITGRTAHHFGSRTEEASDCTHGGVMDVAIEPDWTTIRPARVVITSPAPGADPCRQWIHQDPNDPEIGLYAMYTGVISLELEYRSDFPFDPGFVQVAAITVRAGDGNPASDVLPDFTAGIWEVFRDAGTLVQRELVRESDDFTSMMEVLGYDGENLPNHLQQAVHGVVHRVSVPTGDELTTTYSGYSVESLFGGGETEAEITTVVYGGVSVESTADPLYDFSVFYQGLTIHVLAVEAFVEMTLDSGFDFASSCMADSFEYETFEPVTFLPEALCPVAGKISVSATSRVATILFNLDGSVSVDEGSDGTIDRSWPDCMAPAANVCDQ